MHFEMIKLCKNSIKKLPLFMFLMFGIISAITFPALNIKNISTIPCFLLICWIFPIIVLLYTHKTLYPKTTGLEVNLSKRLIKSLFHYYSGIIMVLIPIVLFFSLTLIIAYFSPLNNVSVKDIPINNNVEKSEPLLLFGVIISYLRIEKYKLYIETIILIPHFLTLLIVLNNLIPSSLPKLSLSVKNDHSELFLIYSILNNLKSNEEIIEAYKNSKWMSYRNLYVSGLGCLLVTASFIILFLMSNIANAGYAYSLFLIFSMIFIFFTTILSFYCSWKAYEEVEKYKPKKKQEVKVKIDLFDKLRVK